MGHYQAAHELRHAQATFALAWCYQRGLGVRRDLHLAKRHFGLAAEADADAAWPVRLALGLLYAEWGLQEAARRRPGAAARLGRLYDALGAAAAGGRRSPHDAAAATLAAALAGLVALRVVAVRRRRAVRCQLGRSDRAARARRCRSVDRRPIVPEQSRPRGARDLLPALV